MFASAPRVDVSVLIRSVLVFLVVGWAASATGADEDETSATQPAWKLVTTTQGVQVFNRPAPESDLRQAKAIAVLDAPLDVVLGVITDLENYKDFMPYTAVSRVMHREDDAVWFFTVLKLPFVGDRYYTIKLVSHPPEKPGDPFRVAWTLAQEHLGEPEGDDLVATPLNEGYWELLAVGERRVRVTYYVYTDPGGSLPAFIANIAQKQSVPKVIFAVRDRARETLKRAQNGS